MTKTKKWKCSECGFPASDAGIVRAHQGRIHHGFGTIEHNDTEVIDMTTERPDGTQGNSESPKAPAEALRQEIHTILAKMCDHFEENQHPFIEGELVRFVTAYAATVEREGRIDEEKGFPLMFERLLTKEYMEGLNLDMTGHGALDFVKSVSNDRLAALQGPQDEQ